MSSGAFSSAAQLGPGGPAAGGGPGTPGGVAAGGPTWGELAAWAAWLEETYGVGLLACWPRHAGVVQELTALLAARLDAEDRGGRALADWHSVLAAAATRIRDALSACSSSRHEPSAHRRLDPASTLLPEGASAGDAVPVGWAAGP